MEYKELMLLVFRSSMYISSAIAAIILIWFIVRTIYLIKKHNMIIDDALDATMHQLTKFLQKMEHFSLEIQKAQLKTMNPEISVYLQHYEISFQCWLQKLGFTKK